MERLTQTSGKGGVAFTFDLDITCQPSEAKKILKLAEKLKSYEDAEEQGLPLRWIPIDEKLPDVDEYIIVSFENFTVPMIGRYTVDDDDNGTFRIGDEDESFIENDLYVNAWMPLPKPYREREE